MKSRNFEFLRGKRTVLADLTGFAERYRYKETTHKEVKYDPPKMIIAKLHALEAKISNDLDELEWMP